MLGHCENRGYQTNLCEAKIKVCEDAEIRDY